MSDYGKQIRLNHIFRGGRKKALVVAFDHALVLGPIAGTTNPREQIGVIADSGADAILMNLGILRLAHEELLNEKAPALIIRLDWTSAWSAVANGAKLVSKLVVWPEEALRYGADAALCYLFWGTGDMEFEAREVARLAKVARECERLGLPLIVETLARGKDVSDPTSPEWIKLHTRVAVELGADVIKTEYTGDVDTMRDVVATCPVPILILGGKRQNDGGLEVVRGTVASGAAGVFFGRNVFQAPDIPAFLKNVRDVLDQGEVDGSHYPLDHLLNSRL
jgi:DhnA family fructose-bisphosphate aldolase class Ia